jgi:hypothetical protein
LTAQALAGEPNTEVKLSSPDDTLMGKVGRRQHFAFHRRRAGDTFWENPPASPAKHGGRGRTVPGFQVKNINRLFGGFCFKNIMPLDVFRVIG